MIHVLAMITTKPGKRDEVLNAFKDNIPAVLEEDGCIEYRPVVDASMAPPVQTPLGPDSFVVIEKWSSAATLEAHGKSAHMAAYAEQVGHLLSDRVIHVLDDIQ